LNIVCAFRYPLSMTENIDDKAQKLQITAAHCVGNFDSSQPEWHELRKGKIGGSMVGTIAGLNKWESAVTAFYKFTGQIGDSVPDSPAMEWGRRLESVVVDKFEDNHPELVVHREVGTWINNKRDFMLANPDALLERDGSLGVLEIKTARYADDWVDSNGEWRVPPYYETQVQWYLATLGLEWGYVAVLFSGSDYREFEIRASEFQQHMDLKAVEAFLHAVKENKAPDWDGSASTYETTRRLHPEIDGSEVELGQLGADYLGAAYEAEKAAERLTELKSRVMAEMGNAKVGLVGGVARFWRRSRSGGAPFLVAK
jgi:putative phage-type endonuclease